MINYPEDQQLREQAGRKLAQPARFDEVQWQKLVYLQAQRAAYSQNDLRRIVQETLAPGLRRSQAR